MQPGSATDDWASPGTPVCTRCTGYAQVRMGTYARVRLGTPGYARVRPGTPGYSWVGPGRPGYALSRAGAPRYAWVRTGTMGCIVSLRCFSMFFHAFQCFFDGFLCFTISFYAFQCFQRFSLLLIFVLWFSMRSNVLKKILNAFL